MNELLARAGALFVAAEPAVARAAPPPPVAPFVAVLAAESDLAPVAGAVAAALRRRSSARTAVVCRPSKEEGSGGTAWPAANRLARRLAAREMRATAAGMLCTVALAPDPLLAVRDARRLHAAVDVPLVLALPGRLEGFDEILAQVDELYLAAPAGAPEALAALALESLARLGPPVTPVAAPASGLGRRWAALGLAGADGAACTAEVPA